MPATPEKGVWLEVAHTRFKGFEARLPSAVGFLSGRLPLNERFAAVAEVPFSYARVDLFEEEISSNSVLGNPYLGVELAASELLTLGLGLRAPLNTADEQSFADVFAFMADPLRVETFLEDVVPVSATATFSHALAAPLSVRAHAGVMTLFWTDDESNSSDTALDYGALASYNAGLARFGAGIAGRWYATEDDGSFAETSLHHVTMSSDVRVGTIRPGISLRLPLDKPYREVVSSTVGLYLQVPVR
jgi:hypothetical protein